MGAFLDHVAFLAQHSLKLDSLWILVYLLESV